MKPGPVDPETMNRTYDLIAYALRNGLSVVETLNRSGLLLTPEQEHRIRLDAVKGLREDLKQWRPHEYLRRHDKSLVESTPRDVYTNILEYVDEYITALEKETL